MKSSPFHPITAAIASFFLTAACFGIGGGGLDSSGHYTPAMDVPDSDHIFVYAQGHEQSYQYLWHGIGPSIDNARKADILVIGNSRAQLGLLGKVIVPLARQDGLSIFWLATGHDERSPFFDALFRKFQFMDKVVLVQDEALMSDKISQPARHAMDTDYWDSLKEVFEKKTSWFFQSHVHRFLPKNSYMAPFFSEHILYRSEITGAWHDALAAQKLPKRPISMTPPTDPPILSDKGKTFLDTLARLGNRVIIFSTPNSSANFSEFARRVALSHGLSVIPQENLPLFTYDGSHLHQKSARLYSHHIYAELKKLSKVKKILSKTREQ